MRAGRVRQTRHAYTETDWEVYPPGLTNTLVWIRERYGDRVPVLTDAAGAEICFGRLDEAALNGILAVR